MEKTRLEAFSDGVIAILITIMVLEFKVPAGSSLAELSVLAPQFLSYAMSFIYIGIYWNNHHHMLQVVKTVNGNILWANLALLFWLSLVPFATDWMQESHFSATPVALYGVILFLAGLAYYILSQLLIAANGEDSMLGNAVGKDCKGITSIILYAAAILIAFWYSWLSVALYASVALMWFIPDHRIERFIKPLIMIIK